MGRSRVTDEQLRAAAEHAQNLQQLLRAVGLAGRGGNYVAYRRRLLALGITDPRFQQRLRPPDPGPAQLRTAAAASLSTAGVCRALGLPTQGAAWRRVARLLLEHDVDTAHFTGQAWTRRERDLPERGRPLDELLRRGSRIGSSKLKQRLLRAGLVDATCSGCGGTTWCDRPMPLELDHVNGDRTDNRWENLRLLCPNCHALTDTYRGRNIGRGPSLTASPP